LTAAVTPVDNHGNAVITVDASDDGCLESE